MIHKDTSVYMITGVYAGKEIMDKFGGRFMLKKLTGKTVRIRGTETSMKTVSILVLKKQ